MDDLGNLCNVRGESILSLGAPLCSLNGLRVEGFCPSIKRLVSFRSQQEKLNVENGPPDVLLNSPPTPGPPSLCPWPLPLLRKTPNVENVLRDMLSNIPVDG